MKPRLTREIVAREHIQRRARSVAFATAMIGLGLVLSPMAVFAQQVQWKMPGILGAGHRGALELVFEDTEPAGRVSLPRVEGLQVIGAPSQSTNLSFVNGQRSSTYVLSYPVRAEREGAIVIPEFQVSTGDGPQTVGAITLNVQDALRSPTGAAARAGNGGVRAQLTPSDRSPYAGEVFDVDVVVALQPGQRGQLTGTPTWDKGTALAEPWQEGQQVNAGDGAGVRFRTRAVVPQAGTVQLAPAHQDVQLQKGGRRIDDVFAQNFFADTMADSLFDSFFAHDTTDVTASSLPVSMNVQPLPQPAPAGFSGAVGTFTLESKLVPEKAKAGEPVTWTLTLRGSGNWPGGVELPARQVPAGFRTLQPKQHKEFKDNRLFDGSVSEDIVLIPNTSGDYELEPVRFVFFNPATERYETVVAQPPVLAVHGTAVTAAQQAAAVPANAPAEAAQASASSVEVPAQAQGAANVNASALPAEPLPGAAHARTPFPARVLLTLLLVPCGLLGFYWMWLAAQRARATDPQRARRAALAQLREAIEQARLAASDAQRAEALLVWQRAAVFLLGIEHAVPSARAVRDHEMHVDDTSADSWSDLWSASEQALYAPGSSLPAQWYEQAAAVCAGMRRSRRNILDVFRWRNLVPTAAAAGLILWASGVHAAATATEEYAAGNFTAAQARWQEQVQNTPTDWVARSNLGLVALQLGDAARAFANTAAAFVLHPTAATAASLATLEGSVPNADPLLTGLSAASGGAVLARVVAPATWQVLLLLGVSVLCIGLSIALRRLYLNARAGSGASVALALMACGVVLATASVLSLERFGRLVHPAAAVLAADTIVRSVPTDAQEDPQAQRPLQAGAVVIVSKDFLGWAKIELSTGDSGWVRSASLVPVYRAPQV